MVGTAPCCAFRHGAGSALMWSDPQDCHAAPDAAPEAAGQGSAGFRCAMGVVEDEVDYRSSKHFWQVAAAA